MLDPALAAALQDGRPEVLVAFLRREASTPLFSLPVLRPETCALLLEEVDRFEESGLPVMRPNSMNNYGVILDEIGAVSWFCLLSGGSLWCVGFEDMLQELMHRVVTPFARLLYIDHGGDALDSHHGFVVQCVPFCQAPAIHLIHQKRLSVRS